MLVLDNFFIAADENPSRMGNSSTQVKSINASDKILILGYLIKSRLRYLLLSLTALKNTLTLKVVLFISAGEF